MYNYILEYIDIIKVNFKVKNTIERKIKAQRY